MIYPPAPGATLASVDESTLSAIPERVRVVRRQNFLGVVAQTEWAAVRAARELKVTWTDGPPLPDASELYDVVHATPGGDRTLVDSGGPPAAAATVVTASYNWPYQSHGSMALVRGGRRRRERGDDLVGDAGRLSVARCDAQMLAAARRRARDVRRGFGLLRAQRRRRAAAAAALLSQEAGAPVRVQ